MPNEALRKAIVYRQFFAVQESGEDDSSWMDQRGLRLALGTTCPISGKHQADTLSKTGL